MLELRDKDGGVIREGFYYDGSLENQCYVYSNSDSDVIRDSDVMRIRRHYAVPSSIPKEWELTESSSKRLTPIDLSQVTARLVNFASEINQASSDQRSLAQDLTLFLTLSKHDKATP